MGAIRFQTVGKPNSAYGVKWYYKPSLNKVVGRKPGVLRRSEKVLDVNFLVEMIPPATRAHFVCLREHPELADFFTGVCPIDLFRAYLSKFMSWTVHTNLSVLTTPRALALKREVELGELSEKFVKPKIVV